MLTVVGSSSKDERLSTNSRNSRSGSCQKTIRFPSSLKMRSSAAVIWLRSLMLLLPDASYPVGVKLWIGADDGNLFVQRLRDQQAVEGVFVVERQIDEIGRASCRE